MADAPLALLVVFQYVPEPSANSVPPTLVTPGKAPGRSTERPGFCVSPQSAPPLSPDGASQVIPCALACCAHCWKEATYLGGRRFRLAGAHNSR